MWDGAERGKVVDSERVVGCMHVNRREAHAYVRRSYKLERTLLYDRDYPIESLLVQHEKGKRSAILLDVAE